MKDFSDKDIDDFFEWIEEGVKRGWVSKPVCATHDGLPMTAEEEQDWDEGYDSCVIGMRLWVE